MLKRLMSLFLSLIALTVHITAWAEEPQISAESAVVLDSITSTVLYEKNAYSPCSMASTTKIMTCLIACESGKLNNEVRISEDMLFGVEGTAIYLNAGDSITLYDLVKGAMLASGNDAANAIAVYLSGSVDSFCDLMNKKAAEIGMKDTLFVTPSGLDKGEHHSTAFDMALLASFAMSNREFSTVADMKSAEIKINNEKKTLYNHNKLLSIDSSFSGVKTGFTKKAGRCLVSSYEYNSNRFIIVTLNAPNDWNDHQILAEYAKSRYTRFCDTITIDVNTVSGIKPSIKCEYSYDVFSLDSIEVKLYYYPIIYSPVKVGEKIGFVKIYSGGTLLTLEEIKAIEEL